MLHELRECLLSQQWAKALQILPSLSKVPYSPSETIWRVRTSCPGVKKLFLFSSYTPGRRQSKTLLTIDERRSKIARNSVFYCHLSPVGRQMAIKNSVSNDFFLSMFIDSVDVFDCRLPGVKLQGWNILKNSTHPTCPHVFVNSIIYIGNSQNFYSYCIMRYSPWQTDK